MADKPCNTCQNWDPIIVGKSREACHGRCAAKSTYPAVEQGSQHFPPGVRRVENGQLAKPVIVIGTETMVSCTIYCAKPTAATVTAGTKKLSAPVTRKTR